MHGAEIWHGCIEQIGDICIDRYSYINATSNNIILTTGPNQSVAYGHRQ